MHFKITSSNLELKSRNGEFGEKGGKAEKGGKGGFGCAISLLAKVVSKRTTGHRVPVHYNSLENIKYNSWCAKWKMWDWFGLQ